MRRYAVLVVLAVLAGLVIGAVAVEAAPQTKPPTKVEVVNGADSAVPVVANVPPQRFIAEGATAEGIPPVWVELPENVVLTDLVFSTSGAACNFTLFDPDSFTAFYAHGLLGAESLHLNTGIQGGWFVRVDGATSFLCNYSILATGYTP